MTDATIAAAPQQPAQACAMPEPITPAAPEGSSVVMVDGVEVALPPGTYYDPATREIVGAGGVRVPISAVGGN